MKKWWNKKKQKTRKYKKSKSDYNFWDMVVDVLIFIPELLFLPFRILFWIIRGFGRVLENIFDIF